MEKSKPGSAGAEYIEVDPNVRIWLNCYDLNLLIVI
jgi:hypothetical protein